LIIKVAFDFDLGIPIIPDDIKERVRQGEQIDIEILPQTSGFAKNALKHGVAGLWVDGGRILAEQSYIENGIRLPSKKAQTCFGQAKGQDESWHKFPGNAKGRWPSNLIHDGSDEVVGLFPVTSSGGRSGEIRTNQWTADGRNGIPYITPSPVAPSRGSAARFFQCCPQDNSDLLFWRAKAIMGVWNQDLANTVDDHSSLSREHAASVLSRAVTETEHDSFPQ